MILASAVRGQKGSGREEGRKRLLVVNTRRLSALKYELVCHFIVDMHADMSQVGISPHNLFFAISPFQVSILH